MQIAQQLEAGTRSLDGLRIFGVDEAGRGAMAGPLAVAAVEYPWPFFEKYADKVRDSKVMSAKARETECQLIVANCQYACVMIDPGWIDRNGIQAAEREGLIRACAELAATPSRWETDGLEWPDAIVCDGTPETWSLHNFTLGYGVEERMRFMIKGDAHVPAISAASIVAKTMRDNYMKTTVHEQYPDFRFDLHVGYVTALHREKLEEFGSTPVHRHSVRPVRERDARDK